MAPVELGVTMTGTAAKPNRSSTHACKFLMRTPFFSGKGRGDMHEVKKNPLRSSGGNRNIDMPFHSLV